MSTLRHFSGLSEEDLVASFRFSRDNRHFEELYRRTSRQVFGVCLRYLDQADRAEDATHEVFLRAFERFEGFRGNSFSAWVRGIAAHLCLNRLRDVRRQRERLEERGSERKFV